MEEQSLPPIDHDRLFKELLATFFQDFIELFFPQVAAAIDFGHVKFLQQEVFTDVTAGEKRKVDLLVETKLRGEDAGEEGLIIIHPESQAKRQTEFPERLFVYFSRLYEKYRRRIVPIAIFSYDGYPRVTEPEEFNVTLPFLDVLRFRYYSLELRKLQWREYASRDNPVAAALLSKMHYNEEDRVQVKKECFRMIARLQLDPAREQMIAGFFETYLQLTEREEQQLRQELHELEPREEEGVMRVMISYERKGWMKGIEEGKIEGKIDLLCQYVATCFPESAAELQAALRQIKEIAVLERLSATIFDVKHPEQLRQLLLAALEDCSRVQKES
ncbi:Rpn family recombination-promoting nuclease/putative transposase [Cohnella cellulosilytica]|uniref:Rpn family recombination-promoting nuclease/putative transposase n=1 Tax=Cohnella cellulosilytica TaxID=986710 RepID=A0ABW2FET8_9BACL